ncbi:MAG: porin [Terriglobia bacterium]|jgi:phosphate-selective porin
MASKKRSPVALAGLVIVAALFAVQSAQASEVDRLLELLVKKHVLSEEEAAALRDEVEKDKVSERAQAIVEKQSQEPEKKDRPVTASSRIKLSGWAQTRYTNAVGTTNSLELRRARLAVEGTLAPQVSYKVQIEAVKSPALLDARLDYSPRPSVKVTVGQFKIPFSQENLVSSRDLIPIERSLVGLSLVPGRDNGSNGRDIGAQLAGNIVRDDGRPLFDYAVGVFNGAGINTRDDNRRKDVAARLVVHPFAGLSLGGDYYNGASGAKELSRERAGVEFAYVHKPFSLQGEYIWGHDDATRKYGWYTQFAYRLRPRWEALARFDTYDPKRHAGKDVTNTYLVGVNWYLSSWVKLQTNYGLVDQEARTNLTNLFLSQLQFQF